jgi:hypothetical protein
VTSGTASASESSDSAPINPGREFIMGVVALLIIVAAQLAHGDRTDR